MSDRNSFLGGFLLGTVVGGAVGGIMGVLLASRLSNETEDQNGFKLNETKGENRKRKALSRSTEESMEIARRGLEDKIAQLNEAIDDVRQQLTDVNGRPETEDEEPSLPQDA